ERDRGVKLMNQWTSKLETVVAYLNGAGINDPDFPNTDPTSNKDWVARARFSQGVFDVAASYYGGHQAIALTGPDLERDKTRVGFDTQVFYKFPTLGDGTVRGEYYAGESVNADSVKALIVAPASPSTGRVLAAGADASHLSTDFLGWYAMWV